MLNLLIINGEKYKVMFLVFDGVSLVLIVFILYM